MYAIEKQLENIPNDTQMVPYHTRMPHTDIILGWVTFPGYVTLPSHGNFTQTDVVYPALVWLPRLGIVTQAG